MMAFLSRKAVLRGSGAAFVVSQLLILRLLGKVGILEVAQLQTTFSETTFSRFIAKWEAGGVLSHYLAHYAYDFVHPVLYALFLASLMSRMLPASFWRGHRSFWLSVPFVAGLMDTLENGLHVYMISQHHYLDLLVIASAGFACMKWGLVLSCFIVPWLLVLKEKQKRT